MEVKFIILQWALESFEFHFHRTSRQAYNVEYMAIIVLVLAQRTKRTATRSIQSTDVLPYTLILFFAVLI